jgi:4-amino-4-deoxy-L-arabinose transferase-like glycosyltransferase
MKRDSIRLAQKMARRSSSLVRNPEFWALLGLVIASLTLRTALVRIDRIVRWDEPDYLILGRNLFTGRGYTVSGRPELHYAPLFPLTTGVLYPLTHDMKLNSDICFVLFGTLTLLPFYWLSKRLFGVRIAIMAALLLCFFPALNAAVLFWGTMLEPLYLFLLCAAFCAVWVAWEKQSTAACVAAGALYGLAYLTKPEAIVYVGLMLVLLVLGNLRRRSRFRWRSILGIVGMALAFVLVISPYLGFLYRQTGRIMISGKLGVTYVAGQGAVEHDPGLYDRALSRLDEAGEEIIWFSADRFKYNIVDLIQADPRGFVRRVWENVNTLEGVLFARQVFPFYLLSLVALGLFGSAWNKDRTIKELLLVAGVLPVFVFLPFHIELRYFAPMLPILLLWVAKGIAALADWLEQTSTNLRLPLQQDVVPARLRRDVTILFSLLLVLYFVVLQPRVVRDGLAEMNLSRREAGNWLKAHALAEALIMSRDTEVPFYAERRWAATPNEEYARFIAYVRKRGAAYLVVDEREVTVIRPQLSLLLNEDAPPPGLRHVYTAPDLRGKTIVYEVLY